MKRSLRIPSAVVALGLAAALTAAGPTTSAAPAPAAAAKPVPTDFALFASGFGSRASGGQVPVGSGDATAYSVIGCTNRAGVARGNFVEDTALPGLGTLSGIRTRLWTAKKGRVVSSYATQRVAEVVIAQGGLGSLTLEGVRSQARAFHDGRRYRTETRSSVARIVFTPAAGDPQVLDLPAPGDPVVIPGLATIRIGSGVTKRLANGVQATTDGIDISVLPTATRTTIAHARAKIQGGANFGTFRGFSAGIRATGLDEAVKVGRTPLAILPCPGTKGKQLGNSTARVGIPDVLSARTLSTRQMGRQTQRRATAYEQGTVGRVVAADGAVILNGVVGRANVTRVGDRLIRNAKGSRIGNLVVNGEAQEFPESGVIEIPGVLKIQRGVVRRIKNGLAVVGARLTLLDGSGAVIDLGVAELQIRR
ncbi:choice-of-anchor P family protein [Nocardioides sp. cx-173]|uniref:choice-of-anchor P family protein n=1 Tax=Nocardioides sp. cx-173 TaxID=2898796 RepID=UPI001E2CC76B|nr:choice-of-anchor P family protein [Nocardioides sp. cx-173]MCD4524313.1 hypothetical protein [Nocardioides sp. cx-173]UGB41704.1 hypothetical protein LQ940_20400 [Nocardioides sp. cx-173]